MTQQRSHSSNISSRLSLPLTFVPQHAGNTGDVWKQLIPKYLFKRFLWLVIIKVPFVTKRQFGPFKLMTFDITPLKFMANICVPIGLGSSLG